MSHLFNWECGFGQPDQHEHQEDNYPSPRPLHEMRNNSCSANRNYMFKQKTSLKKHKNVSNKSSCRLLPNTKQIYNHQVPNNQIRKNIAPFQTKRQVVNVRYFLQNNGSNFIEKEKENKPKQDEEIKEIDTYGIGLWRNHKNNAKIIHEEKKVQTRQQKKSLFFQRPISSRNKIQNEVKMHDEENYKFQRLETLDDLANKNSIKVSINTSEQSSSVSRVIATHTQMAKNGLLPLSLTTNETMVNSYLVGR